MEYLPDIITTQLDKGDFSFLLNVSTLSDQDSGNIYRVNFIQKAVVQFLDEISRDLNITNGLLVIVGLTPPFPCGSDREEVLYYPFDESVGEKSREGAFLRAFIQLLGEEEGRNPENWKDCYIKVLSWGWCNHRLIASRKLEDLTTLK